jgi:hypothetical protein
MAGGGGDSTREDPVESDPARGLRGALPRSRLARSLLLLALLGALLVALVLRHNQREHEPAAPGLRVAGNRIVDARGRTVVLHGVNRSGTEYACIQNNGIFDGPSDQASVAAMAGWHINAVRVPLNEDCWLGINGAPVAYSGAAYQNAIVAYVNLLRRNGLIAILDLHEIAPGTRQATQQEAMPDADHAPAFWRSVAVTFKDDTYVLFDLFNEPHDVSWSCWLNGGSASVCGTGYAVAGMNALISAVRGTGATNVVLAGGLAYANDLSQWLANRPTDPAGNLAANWHVYNFNACNAAGCYDATAAPVAARVPLVADEIGETDCAHGFIDTLMAWLDAHDSGYLGWAWDTYGCSRFPALISSYDGTPTNFGIGLRDHLAALNGLAIATPDAPDASVIGANTPTTSRTGTPVPGGPTPAPPAIGARVIAPATSTAAIIPTPSGSSATPTATSDAIDVSGSVASTSSPFWRQENLRLRNASTLAALTITIAVRKTSGVGYAGQFTTFWANIMDQRHADTGSKIVYTFTLMPGLRIVPGTWQAAAQFGGDGTPHPAAGDTYSVNATTADGVTLTRVSHF